MSDILASFSDVQAPDNQPATYPGSKKVRKAVAATPDVWADYPSIDLTVGGVLTRFYTVGTLADLLERKPPTIRKWEKLGYIPAPKYVTPGRNYHGRKRLYTREAIEGIVEIAREEGITGESNRNVSATNFTARVTTLFKELGV